MQRSISLINILKFSVRGIVVLLTLSLYSITASAASLPACKSGHVCLYKDDYYQAGMASYGGYDRDYGNGFFPDNVWDIVTQGSIGSINDEISSIKNEGNSCSTTHYFDKDYKGTSFLLKRRYHAYRLNGHNDKYSSHHWCS